MNTLPQFVVLLMLVAGVSFSVGLYVKTILVNGPRNRLEAFLAGTFGRLTARDLIRFNVIVLIIFTLIEVLRAVLMVGWKIKLPF